MSILILEHSPEAGAQRLATTLRDYGHRLRVIELHRGEPLPPDLDDVDGVVTAGGPQSALDAHDWIAGEMELLRRADEGRLPVVGLCLGAQVLARALGGEVGPVEGGIELGWVDIELTAVGVEDVLHAGLPWKSRQLCWHREQVTKVPEGARVLAKSARCPVQAFARGLRTYAFQYHPEVVRETVEVWAAKHPGDVTEAGTTLDELKADTGRYFPAFERITGRLFESIALFLMPQDRRIAGLVKDLHH